MSSTGSTVSIKPGKDLACVDCQRRKKKCDKRSPCSNCIKNNVKCVASSPAQPRKRRQPIKEVLRRLAAVEARLDLCQCQDQDQAVTGYGPPLQKQSQAQRHRPRRFLPQGSDIHGGKFSNNNNNNKNERCNHNNAIKPEMMLPPLVATLASTNPAFVNVFDYKLPKLEQGFQETSCHKHQAGGFLFQ